MANTSNFKNGIECDICTEYMVGPVFICAGGHSLCHNCHKRIEKCPFCKSTFQSAARNIALERIIGILMSKSQRNIQKKILGNETLRCMKCKNIMNQKIGICDVGHNLCWKCLGTNSRCTICSSYKRCSRNYKLEEFIDYTMKDVIDCGISNKRNSKISDDKEKLGPTKVFRFMSMPDCCLDSLNDIFEHVLCRHEEILKTISFNNYFRILLGDFSSPVNIYLKKNMKNIFIINITFKNPGLVLKMYQLTGSVKYRFGIRCPREEDVITSICQQHVSTIEVGNQYIQKFKSGNHAGHPYVSLRILRV